jgi:hypothetical protein
VGFGIEYLKDMVTPTSPARPVSAWKRLAIVSFFGGSGLAFAAAFILGSFVWYKSRPKPPAPWNRKAITATYDLIETGDENHIVFYYVLQNTTDQDYRVETSSGIDLTGKLKQENSLSQFKGDYEKIEYPIFIPAQQRLRFTIEIPYPYEKTLRSDAPIEERRKFHKELEQFVGTEMGNLNGFVLFDNNRKYEIDFPKGWDSSQAVAGDTSKTAH